ncbi:MAG: helix-turn-helix transcriptional regulator [Acidobacteriota bacterium]
MTASQPQLEEARPSSFQGTFAGLTQADLASKVGLSAGHLGQVENGRKALSVESLLLIAKALRVEPFELMPGQAEVKRRRAEVEGSGGGAAAGVGWRRVRLHRLWGEGQFAAVARTLD